MKHCNDPCDPCVKYLVIKEFTYVGNQGYNPGDIFQTESTVLGLIHKGIIRRLPDCCDINCDPCCIDECSVECLTRDLCAEKDYDPNSTKVVNTKYEDIDPGTYATLEAFLPSEKLKRSKRRATKKLAELEEATKGQRAPKQVEMKYKDTELVDETNKIDFKKI